MTKDLFSGMGGDLFDGPRHVSADAQEPHQVDWCSPAPIIDGEGCVIHFAPTPAGAAARWLLTEG